jgi:hypothetical protein
MRGTKLPNQEAGRVSRRAMLRTAAAAAAAVALTLEPSTAEATCQAQSPIEYGTAAGHALTDQNISRLFAAWLVLTTNAPDAPTTNIIQAVANLGPNTAKAIFDVYSNANCQSAFQTVRQAFGCLAYSFAAEVSAYSGGQCPEKIDTINPVTTLDGAIPTSNCAVTSPSTINIQCPDCFPEQLKTKFKVKTSK